MERINSRQGNRRGFNLIEAAIVLGVVGFVLGGIWWAASAYRQQWQMEAMADVLKNVTSKISRQMPRGDITHSRASFVPWINSVKVLPKGMVCWDTGGNLRCSLPFDPNRAALGIDWSNVDGSFPPYYRFMFFRISKKQCFQLQKSIIRRFPNPSERHIAFSGDASSCAGNSQLFFYWYPSKVK